MMRNNLLLLLPLLLLALAASPLAGDERSTEGENLNPTTPNTIAPADRDAQIAAIRKEFTRLQPLLEKLPKESYEFEAEGEPYWETTTGWKENGNWVKIQSSASSEHGHQVEDFYLKDGKLFFYYYQSGSYYYFPEYNYTKIDETRLYFAEGKLIYQLDKNFEDKSKEKVDLTRVPNQEVPLPPNPEEIYERVYDELTSLIDTLKEHRAEK